jgi:hypothetical protein
MTHRAARLAALLALIASGGPAAAQGHVPRSPSDRAVSMRGGAPDLALDSRLAGSSPTSASNAEVSTWTRRDTGLVLVWVGLPMLAVSAIAAGVATEAARERHVDPVDAEAADATATAFGVTSAVVGTIGLGLLIPGLVLTFEEQPAVTARVHPGGGSLSVRF